MNLIRRFIYLIYYFKELDWVKFGTFMKYVSRKHKISPFIIWMRILYSSLRYNISILEYFQFRFYEITDAEKEAYAGTGFMYEYQLIMNPKQERKVLADKIIFLREYAPFVKHKFTSLQESENNKSVLNEILNNPSGKVVIKDSFGQCGVGVEVLTANNLTAITLLERMRETKNDLVEEFVMQHAELMKLSPSGLNTIRIVTQLNHEDEVEIIGTRLRITVDSIVDNLAAGNLAASIDSITGIVEGPGVYSDITRPDQETHPVTGVKIVGFQVPFWAETIKMIHASAQKNKSNRSIGWDVAITPIGPELIEGNHDWCKLLWQLPVKKGLKPILESYLRSQREA